MEIEVTPTGYVVHPVTEAGPQLLERFNTDEHGTFKLLATLHQQLDADANTTGVVWPKTTIRKRRCSCARRSTGTRTPGLALIQFAAALGGSGRRVTDV